MFFLGFMTIFVFLSSMVFAFALRRENRSLSYLLICAYLFFVTQISMSILALGLVGPFLTALNLMILNGVLSSFILYLYRNDLIFLGKFVKETFINRLFKRKLKYNNVQIILSILFSIELMVLLGKVYFFPNYVWDEMVYHLHPVAAWYQDSQIFANIETPNPWMNSEILGPKFLAFWFVVYLGNDTFLNINQYFSAIFLFLLSYRFLRFQNLNTLTSFCGALLVFHLPLVLIQTQTNQDHITLAAYAFSCLLFAYEFVLKNRRDIPVYFGISLGLLLSSKTVAIMYALIILFVFFIYYMIFEKYKRRIFLQILISFAIAFVIAGYWYLKNLNELVTLVFDMSGSAASSQEATGNNFLLKLFQKHGIVFLTNLKQMPERILDWKYPIYQADSTKMSSFGVQFFSVGIIGFLYSLFFISFSKKKKDKISFAIVLTCIGIQFSYFTFYLSDWNYRLFQLTPIVGILFGIILIARLRFKTILIFAYTIAVMGFNFFSTLFADYSDLTTMKKFVMKLEQNERSVASYYHNLKDSSWTFINQYMSDDEPIAYISNQNTFVYPYFGTEFKRKIHYIDLKDWQIINGKIRISNDRMKSLQTNGVRFIHLRKDNSSFWEPINSNLVEVTEGLYFLRVLE
ncbi:putative membrane protein [Leptospira noguchii]|uniref:Putative membrane protein n=2 Tax=Leptospira noguchii TaxID=28182 RepID=M6VKB5_9LEPT|nr:putative membrane protein [Leptospira noguchii]